MKVLVVGSGGREHALAWRLASEGNDVLVAPGNAGTSQRVAVSTTDIGGLLEVAKRQVDLTIVGPEAPLAAGLVDRFLTDSVPVFGPSRNAARLEWSKAWTKDFLLRYRIPTGGAEVVDSESTARSVIARSGLPTVLKADGLAGGKGVFVVRTATEVDDALDQLFGRRAIGSAADHVLVEECLEGPELSVLGFTDGERLAVMPPARDYKRLQEDDRGPNTGGMGGFTRPDYATADLLHTVETDILQPTLRGMLVDGTPYKGVLYAGLMLTQQGPKVLEFNCRFGDPECQLILPLLSSRLSDVCRSVVEGRLRPDEIAWSPGRTYGVVLASYGYPEAPTVGDPIEGLDDLPLSVLAFHAGTRIDNGRVVTAGGRVLTLVGTNRADVYRAAETVGFEGKQFRRDIGIELAGAVGAAR